MLRKEMKFHSLTRKIADKFSDEEQKEEDQNLYLTVSGSHVKLPEITSILKKYSSSLSLKRFDQVEKDIEVSFLIDFDSFEEMNKAREELNKLSPDIKISYLDKISFY